jgi:hypothetical protein
MEQQGVLHQRNSSLLHRDKRALQRQSFAAAANLARVTDLNTYDELQHALDSYTAENKASLARDKELKAEYDNLKLTLTDDFRRADVKVEMADLRKQVAAELEHRRELRSTISELDTKLKELRHGPLAGVRIKGRRRVSSPLSSSSAAPGEYPMSDPLCATYTTIVGTDTSSLDTAPVVDEHSCTCFVLFTLSPINDIVKSNWTPHWSLQLFSQTAHSLCRCNKIQRCVSRLSARCKTLLQCPGLCHLRPWNTNRRPQLIF